MAEWSIAAVLKTVVGVSPPRVRISAPPNKSWRRRIAGLLRWSRKPVGRKPSEVRILPPPMKDFKVNFQIYLLWRGRVVVERACLENT